MALHSCSSAMLYYRAMITREVITGVDVKTGGSRVGSRTVRLRLMVAGGGGHDVYLGSGPLYGGNTLLPA